MTRSGRRQFGFVRHALGGGRGVHRRGQAPYLPRAERIDHREHRQHGRQAEDRGDPFRQQAAGKAAERPGSRDAAEALLRRSRIEPLAGDQPEARAEDRASSRDLQIDHARNQGRCGRGEQPLDQKEDRADGERRRHERGWG